MRKSKIKGCAFDLEGTLLDIEKYHYNSHLKTANKYGLIISFEQAIHLIKSFVGGPDEAVANEISILLKNKVSPSEILLTKQKIFTAELSSEKELKPREGVIVILDYLINNGYKICIGSVTRRNFLFDYLKKSGLSKYFNETNTITYEDVTSVKPNPEVYQKTASLMEIKEGEQIVFEDSIIGVQSGNSAGSIVIAIPTFRDKKYFDKLLVSGANFVLNDWDMSKIISILHN